AAHVQRHTRDEIKLDWCSFDIIRKNFCKWHSGIAAAIVFERMNRLARSTVMPHHRADICNGQRIGITVGTARVCRTERLPTARAAGSSNPFDGIRAAGTKGAAGCLTIYTARRKEEVKQPPVYTLNCIFETTRVGAHTMPSSS